MHIATKVDNVVDAVDDVNDTRKFGELFNNASANEIGKIGELLAGVSSKGKTKIFVNGRNRIPDILTDNVLGEVKNVKYISNTLQLRDFADFAKSTGRSMELYVRPTTKIAKTVTKAGWKIKYLW